MGHSGKCWMEKMRFQVSAKCESFARTNIRGENIPDSRSCRGKTSSTKWDVTTSNRERTYIWIYLDIWIWLAEADRRVLHGVYHWTRLAWCGGLQVYIGLWFIVAILNLIRSWTGNQCSWLKVARLEVRFRVRTHAKVFWVHWRRKIYFCRIRQSLRSPTERWQGQQRQYGSLKSQSNHEYV